MSRLSSLSRRQRANRGAESMCKFTETHPCSVRSHTTGIPCRTELAPGDLALGRRAVIDQCPAHAETIGEADACRSDSEVYH